MNAERRELLLQLINDMTDDIYNIVCETSIEIDDDDARDNADDTSEIIDLLINAIQSV